MLLPLFIRVHTVTICSYSDNDLWNKISYVKRTTGLIPMTSSMTLNTWLGRVYVMTLLGCLALMVLPKLLLIFNCPTCIFGCFFYVD